VHIVTSYHIESSRYWLLLTSTDWTRIQFTRPSRRWRCTVKFILISIQFM